MSTLKNAVYKYLPPSRADIFEVKSIRFTQPVLFNDPFESKPHLTYGLTLEEIKQALSKSWSEYGWSTEAVREFENSVSREFLEDFSSLSYDHHEEIYDNIGSNIGVLSLTEKCNNLLMWAHYAQSHEGFVIGFDPSHHFFSSRKNDGQIGELQKVRYSNERPKKSINSVSLFDVYLTKSKEWEYEQEFRLLRHLDTADTKFPVEPYPVCLFKLPPSCIRSVLFGCRMNDTVRDRILSTLKSDADYSHVQTSRMIVSRDTYEIFTGSLR